MEWSNPQSAIRSPPIDPFLAYYGDDFTGSTDVMEALTLGGLETVLFVEPPTLDALREYPHARAVGLAGNSRTMSPEEMESALPAAFKALEALRPQFVHYKVCSTFDSSPTVGSIGRAIQIAQQVFQNRYTPLVVGSPALRRYCVFGNLFARSGLDSEIYRLDRHPTMREHPVTPMTEADLRIHLAAQTDRLIALVDTLALDRGFEAAAAELEQTIRETGDGGIVLFDTITEGHLSTIGRLLAAMQEREGRPLFVAGSSGAESALVTQIAAEQVRTKESTAASVDRVIVASGSCSPVTERQIAWAVEHGFAELALDTPRLLPLSDDAIAEEAERLSQKAGAELDAGRSVVVHTCRGPADPRRAAATTTGDATTARRLGVILGKIVGRLLKRGDVRRAAVTGGDTSGYVARTLGIEALEMAARLAPGAPLCRAQRSAGEPIEITFKGGQVGHDDFFGTLLSGRSHR